MAQAAPEYGNTEVKQMRRQAANRLDEPVVESRTEARQGVTGHGVRYVLYFSTAGVILAFALVYAFFFA